MQLSTAIETGDTATKTAVLNELGVVKTDLLNAIEEVEASVETLIDEYITVEEFTDPGFTHDAEAERAAIKIKDSAENIAGLIESGGFDDVDSFTIENGDILDLTTTGLKNLQAVEDTHSEELLNYKIQLNGPVNGLVNEVVTQLTDDRVAFSVLNSAGTIYRSKFEAYEIPVTVNELATVAQMDSIQNVAAS